MSYKCRDHAPYTADVRVQDGFFETAAGRVPRMVFVPFRMEPGCDYRTTKLGISDKGCVGCRWRDKK